MEKIDKPENKDVSPDLDMEKVAGNEAGENIVQDEDEAVIYENPYENSWKKLLKSCGIIIVLLIPSVVVFFWEPSKDSPSTPAPTKVASAPAPTQPAASVPSAIPAQPEAPTQPAVPAPKVASVPAPTQPAASVPSAVPSPAPKVASVPAPTPPAVPAPKVASVPAPSPALRLPAVSKTPILPPPAPSSAPPLPAVSKVPPRPAPAPSAASNYQRSATQVLPAGTSVSGFLNRSESKKRFYEILRKAPLKYDVQKLYASSRIASGYGLAMRKKRVRGNVRNPIGQVIDIAGKLTATYEVYRSPYKVDLSKYLELVRLRPNSSQKVYICPVMQAALQETELMKLHSPAQEDMASVLYKKIFSPDATAETVNANLKALEQNIRKVSFARYRISIVISRYSEEHKLISQSSAKIEFEIHSQMNFLVLVWDNITKKHKSLRYEIVTKSFGSKDFARNGEPTYKIPWEREGVLVNSTQKMAASLYADLQKMYNAD